MKLLSVIILTLSTLTIHGQNNIDEYLAEHHFSFSLEKGFDSIVSNTLQTKFKDYKLVILGEGGSHYLQFYNPLRLVFVKFLSQNFGMKHFFMETGHSADILWNKFLETGDTSYLPIYRNQRNISFWTNLYIYNTSLPQDKRIMPLGIDFERPYTYVKTLKLLLPTAFPPKEIKTSVDLIKNANDTLYDCDYILQLNAQLKRSLEKNKDEFKKYFSNKFDDFNLIINSNGSCKDVLKNRNKKTAKNFLSFDNNLDDNIYYLQIGMAHSILTNKGTATLINNNPKFKNKVCVINTYCYNCLTPQEQVSNWQFAKIENDILKQLLKYCTTDFTLFDFTEKNKLTEKFWKYGQFLIFVKTKN